MDDMTTRRALEICLSRVPMHRDASRSVMLALASEIAKPTSKASADPEALQAAMMLAIDALSGVGDFPRASLLVRISLARECLQKALP